MDRFTNVTAESPARASAAITPDNTTELESIPKAIYVGNGGNITGQLIGDTEDVVFTGVPTGAILPVQFKLIKSTGTTASSIVGLY
jgi:hypothetical protein